jgi:HPt (histidine-containing phosphotransfer) domain-containing protein
LVFSENVANDLELLNEASGVGNWEEVSQLAHKMKTSLGHFGVTSLKEVMLSLEHPQSFNLNQFDYFIAELNRVISEVLAGLRAEFPEVFK